MVDDSHGTGSSPARVEERELERRTLRKVYWRLLPLMIIAFLVNYIDRANIGYAGPTMNAELGISALAFGIAAGIFSLGYVLFEIPSNVLMRKLGANVWIARIMFTWGIVTICTIFVQGTTSFVVVRLLLGVAEAGFLPGMMLYLTLWVPMRHRGRMIAIFSLAVPLAAVVGGPLSVLLQSLNGIWGLSGWQWIFVGEGVPAVVLAFFVLRYLTSSPDEARWLGEKERTWLVAKLAREESDRLKTHGRESLRAGLLAPIVLVLGLLYAGIAIVVAGIAAWLPTIIGTWGPTVYQAAMLTAIPWAVAGVAAVAWNWWADRLGARKVTVVAPLVVCAAALGLSPFAGSAVWSMVLLSVGLAGFFAAQATFWVIPGRVLSGVAAAGGIALINSIGNLGGFFGPFGIGALKSATGSLTGALPFLAIVAAVTALGFALLRTSKRRSPATGPTAVTPSAASVERA